MATQQLSGRYKKGCEWHLKENQVALEKVLVGLGMATPDQDHT